MTSISSISSIFRSSVIGRRASLAIPAECFDQHLAAIRDRQILDVVAGQPASRMKHSPSRCRAAPDYIKPLCEPTQMPPSAERTPTVTSMNGSVGLALTSVASSDLDSRSPVVSGNDDTPAGSGTHARNCWSEARAK